MIIVLAVLATLLIWVLVANAPEPKARRIRVRDDKPARRRDDVQDFE